MVTLFISFVDKCSRPAPPQHPMTHMGKEERWGGGEGWRPLTSFFMLDTCTPTPAFAPWFGPADDREARICFPKQTCLCSLMGLHVVPFVSTPLLSSSSSSSFLSFSLISLQCLPNPQLPARPLRYRDACIWG